MFRSSGVVNASSAHSSPLTHGGGHLHTTSSLPLLILSSFPIAIRSVSLQLLTTTLLGFDCRLNCSHVCCVRYIYRVYAPIAEQHMLSTSHLFSFSACLAFCIASVFLCSVCATHPFSSRIETHVQ